MDDELVYSLDNLSNDPAFNFLNTISETTNAEEDYKMYDFSDSPYHNCNILCSYMDETKFSNTYKNLKNFSFMSLNIQSLPSKFIEFNDMISNLNVNKCSPDVIALQENWQIQDPAFFPLPNYNLIEFKCRRNNVQGGGVGLYFKNDVCYNILEEKCIFIYRIFESIFAEVWLPSTNKKIIIGSVYRPNTAHPSFSSSEQFSQFFDLLTNLLDDLSNLNTQVLLFGDFNLDALKYGMVKS